MFASKVHLSAEISRDYLSFLFQRLELMTQQYRGGCACLEIGTNTVRPPEGGCRKITPSNILSDLQYWLMQWSRRKDCLHMGALGQIQWIAPSTDCSGRAPGVQVMFIWQRFWGPASGERKQTLICFLVNGSQRASQRPPGGCPATSAPWTRMFGLENDLLLPQPLSLIAPRVITLSPSHLRKTKSHSVIV